MVFEYISSCVYEFVLCCTLLSAAATAHSYETAEDTVPPPRRPRERDGARGSDGRSGEKETNGASVDSRDRSNKRESSQGAKRNSLSRADDSKLFPRVGTKSRFLEEISC